jgi:hypothetical protein
MYKCKCPYCGKSMDDPDDCYENEMTYDYQCPHCENTVQVDVKSREQAAAIVARLSQQIVSLCKEHQMCVGSSQLVRYLCPTKGLNFKIKMTGEEEDAILTNEGSEDIAIFLKGNMMDYGLDCNHDLICKVCGAKGTICIDQILSLSGEYYFCPDCLREMAIAIETVKRQKENSDNE